MTAWSFQLYSARSFTPWEDVYRTLAGLGYRHVEGFGGVYGDAAATRKALDRHGLSMPTGHFGIDALEADFASVVATATTLGISTIYCPHIAADLRPADAQGWRGFGARLQALAGKARDAGFGFGWHNHDFEFRPLGDGSVPMEHILAAAPDIDWEIDVAWVVRGGGDPSAWISRHGKRITAAHVKDIAPAGANADEDGWADVGHGEVDWRSIMALMKRETRARHFIVEHDKPNDFERFARRSIAALDTLGA